MRLFFLIFFLMAITAKGYGATITAVLSGSWTTNSTWSCNCQPTSSDNIIIPAGITVTDSGPAILFLGPVITITIGGTLILNNGSLQVDSSDIIKILAGGKVKGTGITGGAIYSGVIPMFVPNGSTMNGPETITNGTLPVTLLWFKNLTDDGNVVLQWESASEINFDYYAIDRSIDGTIYERLSQVKGSSALTQQKQYTWTDDSALPSAWYRLQAIDMDGHIAASKIISVSVTRPKSMEVFPNPVTNGQVNATLNFLPDQQGQLSVYDCHGSEVASQTLSVNRYEYSFSFSPSMVKGIYFLVMISGTEKIKTRLIIN